jgi:hypothetical protein
VGTCPTLLTSSSRARRTEPRVRESSGRTRGVAVEQEAVWVALAG